MTSKVLVLLAAGLLLSGHLIASPMPRSATPAQNPDRDSIDLDWTAPAGCPDGTAVRDDVIKLTGGATAGLHHLTARASIRPTSKTEWTLSLVTDLDGVTGERTLSGASCESLARAAAVVLALILNPDLAVATPAPTDNQQPLPDAATLASTDRRWPPPRWRVGAHGGIQMGVIENLSSSFGLSLSLDLGRLSLRLMPSLTPPQDVYSDTELQVGGRLWLGTVAALGCFAVPLGRVAIDPCIGIDVTRLQGHGLGVLQVRDATAYWSSAELALFARLSVGHGVLLEVGGIGLLPFARPSVYLEGVGPVSRPAVFGFRAVGGLAWTFE